LNQETKEQRKGSGKPPTKKTSGKKPLGKSERVSNTDPVLWLITDKSRNQKRDLEDAGDSPLLKRRRMVNPEPTPKVSGKRKREDEDGGESPSKRTKAGNVEARSRGNTRVKEFPAGNVATSSSRIAFLKSLCKVPKFQSLVDLVPILVCLSLFSKFFDILVFKFQPRPSPIPEGFPSWASWKSRDVFLPSSFHVLNSFNKTLTMAKKAFVDDSVSESGNIDGPLLLVGLMFREVGRAVEAEADGGSPEYVINSPLGVDQLRKLENLINSVVVSS